MYDVLSVIGMLRKLSVIGMLRGLRGLRWLRGWSRVSGEDVWVDMVCVPYGIWR